MSIVGKVLVFTGTLEMKRAEATQMATAAGATVAGSVSGKTDILVVGRDAGSKVAAAEKKGVAIWTEARFVAACGGGDATAPKATSPGSKKKSAPADEPPAKKAASGKKAAAAAPPSRGQGKARARAQANVASVAAAEILARSLNVRDLVDAVLGNEALLDHIFCRGGLPAACAAAPACKEWSVRAKAAIARWQRVCSSAWSRAGIRDEREWVGSYTDDGDAGDFDGPFWLGATGNGGFVVAEDDQNDMRTQFFDAVGSRDTGRKGRRCRLPGPTITKTLDLAQMASSLGVDRLGCTRPMLPALCAHEDALYAALTLEMVPFFTPYPQCEAARQAAYAARPCTRRVTTCRLDLASGVTHPPAGSLCELEMTYVAPLPEGKDDENHPTIAVHAGTVYVHVGDRIALLDAHTLAPCGSLGAAELTSAATDASRWIPSDAGEGNHPSPQGRHSRRFSMRPESSQVGALAVYPPVSELYVAVPRTSEILVFAIGDHAHSGRCVRRLEGCREARERPVHLAVGGHGGWLFAAAADSNRVLRLSRDGLVLQTVALFECTLAGLAVGSGAVGSSEVYVLCNAPDEWNVYGEGGSTVHVLQIRSGDGDEGGDGSGSSSDEPAGSSAIAAPTAPTSSSWQVKGGFGYGSGDEWAAVPPYLARILEAAHRRGDARLTSMHRGHPLEVVLQPETEMYCSPPSYFGGSQERFALRRT